MGKPPVQPRPGMEAGFTFVEAVITLGILGILVSLVIIAINPTKQLNVAQNAKRKVLVNELESAAFNYWLTNGTDIVTGLPTSLSKASQICRQGVTDASCVNLDALTPNEMNTLPVDPSETSTIVTGYRIYMAAAHENVCNDFLPSTDDKSCSYGLSGGSSSASSASS